VALEQVSNLIGGNAAQARAGTFEKLRPDDGTLLCRVPRSGKEEVVAAVAAARAAQPAWAARTAVERGELVRELALALRARREEGVPGPPSRQCRVLGGVGSTGRRRGGLRGGSPGTPSRGRAERRARARRRGGAAPRRVGAGGSRQLHRLGGNGALDQRARRR